MFTSGEPDGISNIRKNLFLINLCFNKPHTRGVFCYWDDVDLGMKKIEVVAGIITNDFNQILCTQRNVGPYSYISKKFEFPGGKIEDHESHENALEREILEELNLKVLIGKLFLMVEHQYPDFYLTMHAYKCNTTSYEIELNEHIDYKWMDIEDIQTLDWAAADIPIVDKLVLNEHG